MNALSFRSSFLLVAICIAVVTVIGLGVGSAVTEQGKANAARVESVMEGVQ